MRAQQWDCETVWTVKHCRYISMCRGWTLKQSGPWNCLCRHGCYVFSLGANVFTLVMKLDIMKFWFIKLNLILKVKVNHPQNNRGLYQGILHLWSTFGDPSFNGSQVITRTSSGLTYGWAGRWTDGHIDRCRQGQNPKPKTGFGLKMVWFQLTAIRDQFGEMLVLIKGTNQTLIWW